jgi:hypothetical protein
MTALEWLGAIVGLLVAAGIFAFGVGVAVQAVHDALRNWRWREERAVYHAAGKLILARFWWFSEDPSAYEALRCVGEALRDDGSDWRPDAVRETWRKRVKEAKTPHSEDTSK